MFLDFASSYDLPLCATCDLKNWVDAICHEGSYKVVQPLCSMDNYLVMSTSLRVHQPFPDAVMQTFSSPPFSGIEIRKAPGSSNMVNGLLWSLPYVISTLQFNNKKQIENKRSDPEREENKPLWRSRQRGRLIFERMWDRFSAGSDYDNVSIYTAYLFRIYMVDDHGSGLHPGL